MSTAVNHGGQISNITEGTTLGSVCYSPGKITTNGLWVGDNPWNFSLPLFIFQTTIIVVTTRFFVFVLKPLKQPTVIAEIIGGIMLGPSGLGYIKSYADYVFPLRSIMMLETMANLGLLYFLFMVGLEMDITVIKRTGRKAFVIAITGMVLPFVIGASCSYIFKGKKEILSKGSFLLFLGIVVSATAFPVLARILAQLKLLNSELGRIALSAALINDMFAWLLLSLAVAMAESHHTATWAVVSVIFSSVAYVAFCIFIIRPAIYWIIRQTPEGEYFSEVHICLLLTGVMICGFITDTLGTHSIFGAFVYGLVIPNGPLGVALIEKVEDFVSGLLLPIFFAVSGLRTNIGSISADGSANWLFLLLVIIVAAAAKLGVTLLIALWYQMPLQDGIALGLLMNSKGLIEVLILNVGREQGVLTEEAFATMVVLAVVSSSIITPIIMNFYKPSRRFVPYKTRSVMNSKPESEMRMLTCIHTTRNLPTIINLLEATNHSKKSPICVYALHLVELTSRESAMLTIHSQPEHSPSQAESHHIFSALQNYEQHSIGVVVQPLTVISPYSTMHEDICNLAEDKHTALIIVPFHKQQTVDGAMESINPAIRTVNQNVLANAPCSVGIFVDKGLQSSTQATTDHISHHIVVLFFVGPDDREALSYASKMVEHPGISLTLLRFMNGDNVVDPTEYYEDPNEERILTVTFDYDTEKKIDDEFINAFRVKNTSKDSSVNYIEKVVNNGEETVAAIRSIDTSYDLFIVGRGQGMISPLTAGLTDWSECPELGTIGDLLASSDFTATVSVLVMQQHVGLGMQRDLTETPDSNGEQRENNETIQNTNQEVDIEREP